ncbi:MAG: hypothetical protein NVSMB47_07820 [Polyangiales bacterium]
MAAPTTHGGHGSGSVLGEHTRLRGRVRGEGDLEVRGRLEGEVDVDGELVIAPTALIKASLRGARVVIRGAVLGDVSASDSIVLEESARVVGNLTAGRIAIALGAQLRGELTMDGAGEERARPARATTTQTRPAARPAPASVARPAPPPPRALAATPVRPAAKAAPPAPVIAAIKKGTRAAKRKGA